MEAHVRQEALFPTRGALHLRTGKGAPPEPQATYGTPQGAAGHRPRRPADLLRSSGRKGIVVMRARVSEFQFVCLKCVWGWGEVQCVVAVSDDILPGFCVWAQTTPQTRCMPPWGGAGLV